MFDIEVVPGQALHSRVRVHCLQHSIGLYDLIHYQINKKTCAMMPEKGSLGLPRAEIDSIAGAQERRLDIILM